MLEKSEKQDLGLVHLYRVISLLNYLGKVVGKVVAEQLVLYYEVYFKLDLGQTGAQKERSAINAVSVLVHTVQESWEKKS